MIMLKTMIEVYATHSNNNSSSNNHSNDDKNSG